MLGTGLCNIPAGYPHEYHLAKPRISRSISTHTTADPRYFPGVLRAPTHLSLIGGPNHLRTQRAHMQRMWPMRSPQISEHLPLIVPWTEDHNKAKGLHCTKPTLPYYARSCAASMGRGALTTL